MQTGNISLLIHALFVYWKTQNVHEIHTFLSFEKCAEYEHYFIKLDNFGPFCGPSYGEVIILATNTFVDSRYL